MAITTFTVGAVVAHFQWRTGGPSKVKRNNVDVYQGTAIFAPETGAVTSPLAESELAYALRREIHVEPTPASAGGGAFVDYNGTTDPSGVLVLADGTTLASMVLSTFERKVWRADYVEADVEFTKVA